MLAPLRSNFLRFAHLHAPATLLDAAFEFKDSTKVASIFAKYPENQKQAAIIPLLHLAQEQEGWLSRGAISAIAKVTGSQFGRVHETATFYTMFRFKPPCKHVLERCNGLSCYIHEGETFKAAIEKAAGGTFKEGKSKDGNFDLLEVECAGACASAPILVVDGVYYPSLKEKDIETIITKIRNGEDASEFAVGKAPQPKPLGK
jgi:NADH:ubiquinone oxidoreductase subunit E